MPTKKSRKWLNTSHITVNTTTNMPPGAMLGTPPPFAPVLSSTLGGQTPWSWGSTSSPVTQVYPRTLGSAQGGTMNTPHYKGVWMWAGKVCSITEFAELAYGDSPQRTLFLLQYSEE